MPADISTSWMMSQLTVAQRSILILSLVLLFWIVLAVVYISSRFIIRFMRNFKRFRFHYDTPPTSRDKVCRAFVISSNKYGSFRPTQLPSSLLYRSDSLFSSNDFMLANEKISDYGTIFPHIHQVNSLSDAYEQQQQQTNGNSLLEHYLKTYNPLRIDLTNTNTISTSIVKKTIHDVAPSETDTGPMGNCYPLACTNKHKLNHGRYARLREPDNCSATISIIDDRLSESSTKLTSVTLPVVMVTDCSDSRRLHTDIIEMDEDDDKDTN